MFLDVLAGLSRVLEVFTRVISRILEVLADLVLDLRGLSMIKGLRGLSRI